MANGGGADEASGSASSASALRPRRRSGDPVLVVCRCFGVVTAAAALLCVAANVLSAVYSFTGRRVDIIGGVFRCYAVVFSVFVAVIETEWGPVISLWKIFEYLPARGLLQIFVAIMTKAYPNVERNELIVLQEIATYMLLACGAVYIIAGILCLGVLKRSRQHKATSQEQAVKDLEELEKRREELQSLLVAERSETA